MSGCRSIVRSRTAQSGLHQLAPPCIVIRMVRVAVAGASGYAGGELLRLLLGAPGRGDRRAHGGRQRGHARSGRTSRTCCRWPTACWQDTTPETLAGHDVVFLALPHGHSAELAAQLGDDTVVIDCGADHRLADPAAWERWYGGDARRELAVRPARAARRARRAARRPPGRRARLLPDGGQPRAVPGAGRRAGRARGRGHRGHRHVRRGQVAQAAPARRRGDGLAVGVRRRRRAPAHPGDRAEPVRGGRPRRSR